MIPVLEFFEDDGGHTNPVDDAVRWLIIAILAFAVFALGAVNAWAQWVVALLSGAVAFLLVLRRLLHRHPRLVFSWTYLPPLLFALFIVFQLAPLPTGIVAALSPRTAAIRQGLLGDLPNASTLLSSMTISLYPAATREALRMILAVVVVLIAVVNVFRTPQQIARLLWWIAIIGGVAALLAIAQDFTSTRSIYWTIWLGEDTTVARGGPFVNPNNFAQFMNVCIGAAIALLMVRVDQLGFSHRPMKHVWMRLGVPEFRSLQLVVSLVVLGAIAIATSASRGGMISLLAAFTLVTILGSLRRDRTPRGWILLALGMIVIFGGTYFGFDVASKRLAALKNIEKASGDRWQMNKDVIHGMLPKFPVVGTGLATHEWVYPEFSTLNDPTIAGHLENEYLQVPEETGIVGSAFFAIFIAGVIVLLARVMWRGTEPIHAAAIGIAFALLAVLLHSLSDFGQRVPGNACLTAAMCGLVVSLNRLMSRHPGSATPATNRLLPQPILAAMLVLVLGVWVWVMLGSTRATVAEYHWQHAESIALRLERDHWSGSNDDYILLLSHAQTASAWQPDNVEYRHWLNVYRWQAISRNKDPKTGKTVVTDKTREFAKRIVDELHQARAVCPTFGLPYSMAGQIELFVLGQPTGAAHIRTGYELAPTNPTTAFVAGQLDAQDEKWDESLSTFRKSIQLGRSISDVMDCYLALGRPDLAYAAAEDDGRALTELADALEHGGHAEIVKQSRARATELLKKAADRPAAASWELSALAGELARSGDFAAASDYYRRALARDYTNVDLRLALARALAAGGQVPQAMDEVRVCMRLRPERTEAKQLMTELAMRPGATVPR